MTTTNSSIIFDEILHGHSVSFLDQYNDQFLSLKEIDNITVSDASYNFDAMNEIIEGITLYRREHNIGSMSAKYKYPDNFTFIIATICDGKRFENWEDIRIQNELNEIGMLINGEHQTCICGHCSSNIFFFKSKTTNIVIPIGSSCIEKHHIVSQERLKQINKHIRDYKKRENQPICEWCDKPFKPKFEWAKNCYDCYKMHSNDCSVCGKTYLPSYKSRKYSTKCVKCYMNSK